MRRKWQEVIENTAKNLSKLVKNIAKWVKIDQKLSKIIENSVKI